MKRLANFYVYTFIQSFAVVFIYTYLVRFKFKLQLRMSTFIKAKLNKTQVALTKINKPNSNYGKKKNKFKWTKRIKDIDYRVVHIF